MNMGIEKASDIELARELIRRLELNETSSQDSLDSYDYYDGVNKHSSGHSLQNAPHVISIGCGIGYSNFIAQFYFKDDKLLGHGIWE